MLVIAALAILVTLASTGRCEILEFTADYCRACQQMQPAIAELQRQGVPIRRINVQQNRDLAVRFGVDRIPCFVLMVDGQEVDRVVGAVDAQRLAERYQSACGLRSPPIVRGQTGALPSLGRGERAGPAQPAAPPSQLATRPPEGADSPVERALAATVRLRIEDELGHSFGTGTIIDVHGEEALVLTCGHIFRASNGKGRIVCDLFAAGAPAALPGRLVSYDLRRDVALLAVRPGVPVQPVLVGGAGLRPREGDPVFSIGCNYGKDPSVICNRIVAVNRYQGPANLVVGGRPEDGRSGGGLFTSDGMLIGVCNAADQQFDEGLYAALGPVHAELDSAGLGYLYRGPQQAVVASGTPTPTNPSALAVLDQPEVTRDSVQTSASESEVICIVRTRADGGGQSHFYVIERPSRQLLDQLSNELNRRGPHMPTHMHIPERAHNSPPELWRSAAAPSP
jgi:thiol-disulfide isomerase/thioredoxin